MNDNLPTRHLGFDSSHLGNEKLPSVIKNPFGKTHIKSININYTRKLFGEDGEWEAVGRLSFENGDTSGDQKFVAPTFDEVVMKMKACINQLLNEK